jgi:hypothetical protein
MHVACCSPVIAKFLLTWLHVSLFFNLSSGVHIIYLNQTLRYLVIKEGVA